MLHRSEVCDAGYSFERSGRKCCIKKLNSRGAGGKFSSFFEGAKDMHPTITPSTTSVSEADKQEAQWTCLSIRVILGVLIKKVSRYFDSEKGGKYDVISKA